MAYSVEIVSCGHMYSRHGYDQYMIVNADGYAVGDPRTKVRLYDTKERAQEKCDKMNNRG